MPIWQASLGIAPVCSFFFLMMPPPSMSTLFPYTTLFRSQAREVPHRGHHDLIDEQPDHDHRALHQRQDRKSTRLNSSHVEISYAVFCLKKKNKDTHISSPNSSNCTEPWVMAPACSTTCSD